VPANYARIVRRSALLTGAVAVVMVAVSAVADGTPGLIGGLLGVALTAAFFGIDLVTVGRAARVSPQAMMLAAIATYVFKILVLAIVMMALEGTTAFSTRFLAITTIVCVIAWSAAQAITSMKLKTSYVDTGSASPAPAGAAPSGPIAPGTGPGSAGTAEAAVAFSVLRAAYAGQDSASPAPALPGGAVPGGHETPYAGPGKDPYAGPDKER